MEEATAQGRMQGGARAEAIFRPHFIVREKRKEIACPGALKSRTRLGMIVCETIVMPVNQGLLTWFLRLFGVSDSGWRSHFRWTGCA
jgi:hypothetical protein